MKDLPIPNARAALALVIYIGVSNLAGGLYAARGIAPSPGYVWLSIFGWMHVLWLWLHDDYRRLGLSEPLDVGYMVTMAWPFLYADHMVRTRGWKKGLLMWGGLIGLVMAGYLLSLGTYLAATLIMMVINLSAGGGP